MSFITSDIFAMQKNNDLYELYFFRENNFLQTIPKVAFKFGAYNKICDWSSVLNRAIWLAEKYQNIYGILDTFIEWKFAYCHNQS